MFVLDAEVKAPTRSARVAPARLELLQDGVHAVASHQRVVPALELLHCRLDGCLLRRGELGDARRGCTGAMLEVLLKPWQQLLQLRLAERVEVRLRPCGVEQGAQRDQLEAEKTGTLWKGGFERGNQRLQHVGLVVDLVGEEHVFRVAHPAFGTNSIGVVLQSLAVTI